MDALIKLWTNCVNNCEYPLVVLVLCVFGTCRAFVFAAKVFHTWCPHVDFSRALVFVSLRALELMSAQFLLFDFDVTSFARLVRVLSRDRRCDNNHRHHIDSWWRSYGFYIFTKRYDSLEISGEDDQTNKAGARPTGRDLQQQQEWWTQRHLPDDETKEQDWWNQTYVPSRQVGAGAE